MTKEKDIHYEFDGNHQLMQWVGVMSYFSLSLFWCFKLMMTLESLAQVALVIFNCILAYAVADLVSGLVHWTFDRYFSVATPVLGQNFVLPFRIHHIDPKEMTLHGFLATNGNNCLVTLPFLVPLLLVPAAGESLWWLSVHTFVIGLCGGIFATNQFHLWAHCESVPKWVAFLQRKRLILCPQHHSIHHKVPYNTHYCITTGWLNKGLARIGFHEGLERVILGVTNTEAGIEDQHSSAAMTDYLEAQNAAPST